MKEQIIYLDNLSLLISTYKRGLTRLSCPFKVKCIEAVDAFNIDEIKTVYLLSSSADYKLLYQIESKFYPYKYFQIIL